MSQFVAGLLFGMVLQISVGPVCISVLQKGITESFKEAFLMVWGVVLADSAYIVLAMLGISSVMKLEPMRVGIGLAGAALLLYFGIKNLLSRRSVVAEQTAAAAKHGGSLRYGFLLTLSNPLTILFWAGVFGGLIASTQFASPSDVYVFAVGCIAATLLFLTAIAATGKFIGRFVRNPAVLIWLDRAVGLFLIGFAVKLALDVFRH